MIKVCEVLKWDNDGNNDVFVYKAPEEDFNTLTQLIVHESQEAIFFMNGQALDSFGPGRYTLETQNLPLITKALNRLTGDKNPFHCEVYFINKTEQMVPMKWGTYDKIQYIEPTYHFPLEIGMSGEMSVSVDNARKLIIKVVGTDKEFTRNDLTNYLRSLINSKIKPYVAQYMKNNTVSIFEIDEHLETFSNDLKDKLAPDFDDYGFNLNRFMVTTIAKPETKEYEDFKSLFYRQYSEIAKAKLEQDVAVIKAQTEAQKTVIESQAMATKRAQEGYTYQQERGFDVAQDIANNEAKGQFTNIGVGLGTMAGIGATMAGVVGNAVNGAVNSALTNPQQDCIYCTNCGTKLPIGSKFCSQCGNKVGE